MVTYKKYLDLEIFEGKISLHEYPWHFHNCYTLILVEKGLITYEFQDKNVTVEAKEVLIIEPLKVHRNSISQLTVYQAIFIPQEYIEKYTQTIKVINSNVVESIVDLFKKIQLNYGKKEIEKIIWDIFELSNLAKVEQINDSLLVNNTVPAINYDLTINEHAEKAHLSKFHFQRKFKKICGLTIGQLKQQQKTIAAKTLLENGKLPTDVAHRLGYFDQSHFIKYFKKMWATTPKKFK